MRWKEVCSGKGRECSGEYVDGALIAVLPLETLISFNQRNINLFNIMIWIHLYWVLLILLYIAYDWPIFLMLST
jgi:hypothetical protein